MRLRVTTIYLEPDVVEEMKARGINLSQFTREAMRNYLNIKADGKAVLEKKLSDLKRTETLLKRQLGDLESKEAEKKLLDEYMSSIRKAGRQGAPDMVLMKDFQGATKRGYTKSFDEFKQEVLK